MSVVMKNFVLKGVDAHPIEIEISSSYGKPGIRVIGLPDQGMREAKERIREALEISGCDLPKGKIVYNFAPGNIKKRGTYYDLAMAIGLLIEDDQLRTEIHHYCALFGELALNGRLRPCKGMLPLAIGAKKAGIETIIVPKENVEEAGLVENLTVLGFESLDQVIGMFRGKVKSQTCTHDGFIKPFEAQVNHRGDFSDVKGHRKTIEKVVVAAAGGHNLLMVGEPGCGKSMIAKRIPTILPRMSKREALEVTKVYSVAGLLTNKGNLVTQRPFRSPHHDASLSALIGGGRYASPGEISLAHHGVLFLDEIVEFKRRTLEALRQPIEDKVVQVTRVEEVNAYPANFMLVAAMNPCPCGYAGSSRCQCSQKQISTYQQKLSGPIMDRIDIIEKLKPIDFLKARKEKNNLSSSNLKKRVERARRIQRKRYQNIPGVYTNAQMTTALLEQFCHLDADSIDYLESLQDLYPISGRRYTRILKVARTLADLECRDRILRRDVIKAVNR